MARRTKERARRRGAVAVAATALVASVLGVVAAGPGAPASADPADPASDLPVVSAGLASTCATLAGAGLCWGTDYAEQLGNGDVTGDQASPRPLAGPEGLSWASVATRVTHSCGVTTDGAGYCWGSDVRGELGDGDATGPQASPSPVVSPAGVRWASISPGDGSTMDPSVPTAVHTCGVTTEGAGYCWGSDDSGQLGNGDLTGDRSTPSPVVTPDGATWASIVASRDVTCGVTTDHRAYCWGSDFLGQLGNGEGIQHASVPTEVITPPGVSWASISAGWGHVCAVTTEGAGYCWGFNEHGELGYGGEEQLVGTPVPVDAPAGVTWASISSGWAHTCGLTTDGAVSCWGEGADGRLGDGVVTGTDRFSPVPVEAPDGVTFASVVAGGRHSCAVSTAGPLYCWGDNFVGQLGNGELHTIEFAPVPLGTVVVTAPSPSVTYGDAIPDLEPTSSEPPPIVAAACMTGAVAGSPVGTYPVTCSGARDLRIVTSVDGTLTVTKAVLAVDAASASKPRGAPDPVFEWTYSGLVAGDAEPGGLTGAAACERDAGEEVGTYTITCGPGTLDSSNYTFAAGAPAALTITEGATELVARPVVRVDRTGISIRLPDVSARLTSAGQPVPGAPVAFSAGASHLCAGVTDAQGSASCRPSLVAYAVMVLSGGYTATYGGGPGLLGATSHAPVLAIG